MYNNWDDTHVYQLTMKALDQEWKIWDDPGWFACIETDMEFTNEPAAMLLLGSGLLGLAGLGRRKSRKK